MADKDGRGRAAYVFDVAEKTRTYLRELQKENERLRSSLALADVERNKLVEEAAELRRMLADAAKQRMTLDEEQRARLEQENHKYLERYLVLEQKNAHLANLYVASYRLHETLDHCEVVAVIQEIVINLIGCEQYAVFALHEDGQALALLAGMGIDTRRCEVIHLGDDDASRALGAGEAFIAPNTLAPSMMGNHPHPLTALVPLRLVGRTTGAIAIYNLLPQKPGIEAIDRELFELLAVHAGMALYCTQLHAKLGRS